MLENRTDIVEQLVNSHLDVKPFLKIEIESILSDRAKQEAILGNLNFEHRDLRFEMIIEKLKTIVQEL